MAVIERWRVFTCPIHRDSLYPGQWSCSAGHEHVQAVELEVVPVTAYQGAVERAEKAEAELRKAEPVLVAADRIREAYEAMMEGRDVGRLADWTGGQ
jgi:hypothetical protein